MISRMLVYMDCEKIPLYLFLVNEGTQCMWLNLQINTYTCRSSDRASYIKTNIEYNLLLNCKCVTCLNVCIVLAVHLHVT